MPTVVVASAFQALLGPKGLLNASLMGAFDLSSPPIALDRTIWAIFGAHVFYNYPVALRIVGGFWARIRPSYVEAGRMLGASGIQAFFRITLPLLWPAVISAGLLIFVFCFSSFGVILILGGPRFSTVEVEIYRQALHLFNLPAAALLSVCQIGFTFLVMWVYARMQLKAGAALTPTSTATYSRRPRGAGEILPVGGYLIFLIMLQVLPLVALVLKSLWVDGGFSMAYYAALFKNPAHSVFYAPPSKAVALSLSVAAGALAVALVVGGCAALFLSGPANRLVRLLDPLFMLPLSTSAVTLGFGFVVALSAPPLNLRASPLLPPLAHALVAFPFVVRCLLPTLRSIPGNLREAATLMGAGGFRLFLSVDLPLAGRALMAAAVFAFTISLGEFGATSFVARPQSPTMPLAIYRFLGQPGALNHGQAMAMSSLLMLVAIAGFFLIEKAGRPAGEVF